MPEYARMVGSEISPEFVDLADVDLADVDLADVDLADVDLAVSA